MLQVALALKFSYIRSVYQIGGYRAFSFISLALIVLLGWGEATAQSKDLRKADKWYKDRYFMKAIPVYESALREKFRVGIAQKLASCYRFTNHWIKAEALLDSLVLEDKVGSDMLFLYGEALMTNGRYDQAYTWFEKYGRLEPEDSLVQQRMLSCRIIDQIPPFFDRFDYRKLSFNSEGDDHAAIPWGEGIVFTSDRARGTKLMKEKSNWTGRDFLQLYYVRQSADTLWDMPELWSGRLNALNNNVGYAIPAPDSSGLYFTRNIPEPNERGLQTLQIYFAEANGSDRWSRPELVDFANPSFNYMHPAISPDGKTMVFTSDRSGGSGGLDLWMANLRNGRWSRPENMGAILNTPAHEAFPYFGSDGRLFFASKGHPGFGGYDLFVSQQDASGIWLPPVNMGRPINSPLDDITFYRSADGNWGYFSSTRDGGDDDLYYWWRE
jgi:tetratricopeptide (TPR) repeat protein